MKLSRITISALALAVMGSLALVAQNIPESGTSMVSAAKAFLKSLDAKQAKQATYAFDSDQRTSWYFIPLQDKNRKSTRKGVGFLDMSPAQKKAAIALLRSGCSKRGTVAATTIMSLEGILNELEKNGTNVRSPEWYFVTVFGDPSDKGKWGWRLEGHHLSLNFTLEGNRVVSTTPSFYGSNPAKIMTGKRKGLRILAPSEDLALKLFNALDADQQKVAHRKEHFGEPAQGKVKAGVGAPVGLKASKMNADQKALLTRLIHAYTDRMPADIAARELERVNKGGIENVHFAFTGSAKLGEPHTYRVQGPAFVIEFLNTQPDAQNNPANHVHSCWRHIDGDFGI